MDKIDELEKRLVNLKLEKRQLLLSGKNTNRIDELIKEVEDELKENKYTEENWVLEGSKYNLGLIYFMPYM